MKRCEKDSPDIDKKSSILGMIEINFDFDSDAIHLDYSRYAEYTERLHLTDGRCVGGKVL